MDIPSSGYVIEVNKIDRGEWSKALHRFEDATLYQTWSYGSVRWDEDNLSHLVLRKDGEIQAAAQLRIIKIPIVGAGIAYIPFGPLWRIRDKEKDLGNFQKVLSALYFEYVVKRGLLLRILPNEIDNNLDMVDVILKNEGFIRQQAIPAYRTFFIDLSLSQELLRKSLDQKWRNCLNRAERNGLKVVEGINDGSYLLFSNIYKEMHERKNFDERVNINKIRSVQKDLDDHLKMIIMLCESEGEPVSAAVCTAIGDTGIYLLGASNEKGRNLQASYLLQWHLIRWLKDRGCRWYDLGGIDPEMNPGTYHFKAGFSGKLGKEVQYLGQFDGCQSLLSSFVVNRSDQMRGISSKLKHRLKEIKVQLSLNVYGERNKK